MTLSHDPHWLRAGNWLTEIESADFAIVGVGASQSALTPNNAHATPAAVRSALLRYSTWNSSMKVDLADSLKGGDFGDLKNPDDQEATISELSNLLNRTKTLVLIGGDNSITYSGVLALSKKNDVKEIGVITLDAHHDLRDGKSNGSPMKQLVDAGLPGRNVVQIGINDFANSKFYSDRASELGISVIHRRDFDSSSIGEIASRALATLSHCKVIYLDIDVDVCDRSAVPAAPAAMPGGISADQLRQLVSNVAQEKRVTTFDITEIDATIDTPDQRTTRLAALLILEIAAAKAK